MHAPEKDMKPNNSFKLLWKPLQKAFYIYLLREDNEK